MANQFPKHVRKRRANALQYRRRIKGADGLFFERAMQCKASDDESLIQKEAAQMTRLYELEQKRRSIEHPDAFSEAEIEVLAADLLRDLSKKEHYEIKAGSLYPPQTQSVSKEDFDGNPIGIVEEPVSEFIADELSGLDDFINDTRNKYKKSDPSGDLTADEQLEFKVRLRAKEALLKKRRRPPRYLSQCFEWYATNRKGDPWSTEGPEWIRRYRRFSEVMAYIGDRETESDGADRRISEGIESYAEEMADRGKKGQTIKRDLNETIGCFNRVSKYFKLRWKIESPEYTFVTAKEKDPLTEEEQEAFVRGCLQRNDAKAAVLLTMFQGGMMPTEIKRLAIDLDNSVVLNGPIPYLTLKEETKTGDARRRLVPIVLGLELIQDHLIEGIEWLNSGIDPSTPSNTLSKRIRVDTGNPALSTHCLRHTWELLCNMEDISITHQAYIGGWSSADKRAKFSKQMLRYGAKGLQRSKMILALQNDQKKIFQHLMHLGDATKKNNVVLIRQK